MIRSLCEVSENMSASIWRIMNHPLNCFSKLNVFTIITIFTIRNSEFMMEKKIKGCHNKTKSNHNSLQALYRTVQAKHQTNKSSFWHFSLSAHRKAAMRFFCLSPVMLTTVAECTRIIASNCSMWRTVQPTCVSRV